MLCVAKHCFAKLTLRKFGKLLKRDVVAMPQAIRKVAMLTSQQKELQHQSYCLVFILATASLS